MECNRQKCWFTYTRWHTHLCIAITLSAYLPQTDKKTCKKERETDKSTKAAAHHTAQEHDKQT